MGRIVLYFSHIFCLRRECFHSSFLFNKFLLLFSLSQHRCPMPIQDICISPLKLFCCVPCSVGALDSAFAEQAEVDITSIAAIKQLIAFFIYFNPFFIFIMLFCHFSILFINCQCIMYFRHTNQFLFAVGDLKFFAKIFFKKTCILVPCWIVI